MLYKYLPAKRLDVLKSLKIRFTQLRALNDPFEALPLINTNSETEAFIEQMELDAQDLWKNQFPEEQSPENYETLQNTIGNLKIDILERMSPSSIGVKVVDMINPKILILSLSKTFSNLLMWSHYADNHKGFVIGFDESHEFFYRKDHRGANTSPNKVSYTTQRSVTHQSDYDSYEKILCEKSINWAYEEEVRIFRSFKKDTRICSGNDEAGYPIYLFELPKECIKSVYIGANAQPDLKNEILSSIKYHDLCADIYEIVMSKTCYEIEYQKVE
ncbi:DUF2971 domain-containing protein [Methylobacter sp. G7]|uniref:DUF2971 domain-containing protein n=1 Tax=Methylobacter sp. G7 TaxID=3230117 RepID=UPI003D802D67